MSEIATCSKCIRRIVPWEDVYAGRDIFAGNPPITSRVVRNVPDTESVILEFCNDLVGPNHYRGSWFGQENKG